MVETPEDSIAEEIAASETASGETPEGGGAAVDHQAPTDPAPSQAGTDDIIETETPLTEAEREEHDRATKPVEEEEPLTEAEKSEVDRAFDEDFANDYAKEDGARPDYDEADRQYSKGVAEAANAVDANLAQTAHTPEELEEVLAMGGKVQSGTYFDEAADIPAIDLELSGYQRAIEALDNFDRALTIIPFRRRDRALLQVLEAWRAAKPEVLARLERVKQRRK